MDHPDLYPRLYYYIIYLLFKLEFEDNSLLLYVSGIGTTVLGLIVSNLLKLKS